MFQWKEIYIGTSFIEDARIKEILSAQNIKYKDKIESTRGRLATSVVLGGNAFVCNSAGTASDARQFRIFVKRDDYEAACHLVYDAKR